MKRLDCYKFGFPFFVTTFALIKKNYSFARLEVSFFPNVMSFVHEGAKDVFGLSRVPVDVIVGVTWFPLKRFFAELFQKIKPVINSL